MPTAKPKPVKKPVAKATAKKKPAAKPKPVKKTIATKKEMIIVRVNNVPGKMAEVLGILADSGVELWANACFTDELLATVMLIPENASKAKNSLKKANLTDIKISEAVIVVSKGGTKASHMLARKIAETGINISYTFASSYVGSQFTTVFQTDNNTAAVRALNK